MLTIDFDRLRLRPGERLLDLGCGGGRHACRALQLGADVVAADLDHSEVAKTSALLTAMAEAGDAPPGAAFEVVVADALALTFRDGEFDCVVISEVLEHIPDDRSAIREAWRVLKPGGRLAVTVPRWWPERICWALSDSYHSNPGGHCRIYRASELRRRLEAAGFEVTDEHFAHALHSPYWWLKCLWGDAWLSRAYHRMLVRLIADRPPLLRRLEELLNPVLGKSVVLYLERRPAVGARRAA